MKKLTILLAWATLLFSALSFAMDLDQAKREGLVGEKDTGYLGAVVNQPEVQTLVQEINSKRKDIYQQLAKKNNIKLSQVEALAAKKAYTKTAKGQYLWQDGGWVKK